MNTSQIPYITLADLNKVLATAAYDEIITKEASMDLYDRSEAQRQYQIRKAEATKAINVLRDNCYKACASIYNFKFHSMSVKRQMLEKEHSGNIKLAMVEHDTNCREISREHYEILDKCHSSLDAIKQMPPVSDLPPEEASKVSELRKAATENIREAKRLKQDRMIYENERHHLAVSKLKQSYSHSMLEISEKQRDALIEREETKNKIRAAKPEELPALLESLQSELDECLKGGEL